MGLPLLWCGCGATKSRTATEQLLMSDAVDRAVAQIDFHDLAGQQVYFDHKFVVNTKDPAFIGNTKGLGFVNAEYIISSLRQQMVAADLRLVDKIEDANYVVEARLGAVGVDNNEVVYGLPANNGISGAASLVPNTPALPSIPELSVARKVLQVGAAKIGVFAYDRATRVPVWQAGISQATSSAKDTWVLGVGPFQQGTIYRDTQFAGSKLRSPILNDQEREQDALAHGADPWQQYSEEIHFRQPTRKSNDVSRADYQEPGKLPLEAKSNPAAGPQIVVPDKIPDKIPDTNPGKDSVPSIPSALGNATGTGAATGSGTVPNK